MLGERGVRKEFYAVGVDIELGAKRSGIADEIAALGWIDLAIFEELIEAFRPRKNSNTAAFNKSVPRLSTEGSGLTFNSFLQNCSSRNPEGLDFYAIPTLVFGRVIEFENLASSLCMVGIEMGKRDDINLLVVAQTIAEFFF